MIDFSKITLNYSKYPEITKLVVDNYAKNNGCILHSHWKRSAKEDFDALVAGGGKFKSVSWMGGGYPLTTDYVQPFEDQDNLLQFFKNQNTIDVQSGLYQFYKIKQLMIQQRIWPRQGDPIRVLEVGGGYGRLAMFFLAYFGKDCHYVSVDFAPTSLLFAPQTIRQMFPNLSVGQYNTNGTPIQDCNFYSLPAWRTEELPSQLYDLGVNLHSFQEMEYRSVSFYKSVLYQKLKEDGILFTINNPPEKNGWYGNHDDYQMEQVFEEFYRQKYPIGADWEQICGVPTLERAFQKKFPETVLDTICSQCSFYYGMFESDTESICPKCGHKDTYK